MNNMKKNEKISIKTIAQKSGFSTYTVSHALRDFDDVNDKTKKKIIAVSKKLGYYPNRLGRSLASGKSYQIAILIPELSSLYFIRAAMACSEELKKFDYSGTIIMGHSLEFENNLLDELFSKHYDGLITFNDLDKPEMQKKIEACKEQAIPIVICNGFSVCNYPQVYCDPVQESRLMVDHLHAQGIQSFYYIAHEAYKLNTRAIRRFLKQKRLKLNLITTADFHELEPDEYLENLENKIKPLIKSYFSNNNKIGVYCLGEKITIAIQRIFKKHNIPLGREGILLIGTEHAFHSELSPVRITSLNFSYKKFAEEIGKKLLNQIDNSGKMRKIRKFIPVWLETKESTS